MLPEQLEDWNLSAAECADVAGYPDEIKLVHGLTDRGILPFRADARAKRSRRLYSFRSALQFSVMALLNRQGIPLHEAQQVAERVWERARDRVSSATNWMLRDVKSWEVMLFWFNREGGSPLLKSGFHSPSLTLEDVSINSGDGWGDTITTVICADELIYNVSDGYKHVLQRRVTPQ